MEYKQLKDEFENYKKENRKSKLREGDSQSAECEELKTLKQKSVRLETELISSRKWFEEKEQDYIETISNLQCDVTAMEERHKSEIENIKETNRLDVLLLEAQITKQRQRTLELLGDKDAEISRLKADPMSSPIGKRTFDTKDTFETGACALGDTEAIAKRSFETETAVRQLLTRQNSVCCFFSSPYTRLDWVIISCHVMSCHVMSCHVMSCHIISYHVMSQYVVLCCVLIHVSSCPVISSHVVSCQIISSPVHSCNVVFWSHLA